MNYWRRFRQYISDLVVWIGIGRIVASVGGAAIVLAGASWVMRSPPFPIESKIPFASSRSAIGTEGFSYSPIVTTSTIPSTIMVHVAGEVMNPGIVVIAWGSRVIAALSAAGGPTSRADLNSVNLAAPLFDAAQLYIPRRGEISKPLVIRPKAGVNLPTPSTNDSPLSPRDVLTIDVNTATEQQLDTLPGVGPSTAKAIVAYRLLHGPFARVEDLLKVRGIGPAKLEALMGLVRV
ncbi:MAG: helix-hairpin-helix domain-containing protein [Ilumatobacteraceae bacterium]